MLAAEDDYLGVNFDPRAGANSQPFWLSTMTIAAAFEAKLRSLTSEQRQSVIEGPTKVVEICCRELTQAFCCQIQLLQEEWIKLYEPHAFTSIAYGGEVDRDAVRKLVREYARHVHYIAFFLQGLKRASVPENSTVRLQEAPQFSATLEDLEWCLRAVTELRDGCERFLQQQLGKISLEESRMSMQEARDLSRLSYLAFIFVPLSLVSSWFGMNVDVLDGSTPVWVSVVVSVGILLLCVGIMRFTTLQSTILEGVKKVWERNISLQKKRNPKRSIIVHIPLLGVQYLDPDPEPPGGNAPETFASYPLPAVRRLRLPRFRFLWNVSEQRKSLGGSQVENSNRVRLADNDITPSSSAPPSPLQVGGER